MNKARCFPEIMAHSPLLLLYCVIAERVVEVAEPGPRCSVNAGQVMDNVIGGMGTGVGTGVGHRHGGLDGNPNTRI